MTVGLSVSKVCVSFNKYCLVKSTYICESIFIVVIFKSFHDLEICVFVSTCINVSAMLQCVDLLHCRAVFVSV